MVTYCAAIATYSLAREEPSAARKFRSGTYKRPRESDTFTSCMIDCFTRDLVSCYICFS